MTIHPHHARLDAVPGEPVPVDRAIESARGSDRGGAPHSVGKPVFAVVLGALLMVVAFANLEHLPGLAQDFGTVWVYLVFFLYMSIGGRLFWWGADTLVAELRKKSNAGDRR